MFLSPVTHRHIFMHRRLRNNHLKLRHHLHNSVFGQTEKLEGIHQVFDSSSRFNPWSHSFTSFHSEISFSLPIRIGALGNAGKLFLRDFIRDVTFRRHAIRGFVIV